MNDGKVVDAVDASGNYLEHDVKVAKATVFELSLNCSNAGTHTIPSHFRLHKRTAKE
ncbi:hypothetical protein [Planococcus glaciei]|uniref:hypothetical protein n=1 Tax=Planococcus glaciei TaxID=459472 RepID=UPI001C72C8A5|nr:hypothetical protein [Planococcus glaciei]MBX0313363.1 hypothetical protein [Planococcus glaciei]